MFVAIDPSRTRELSARMGAAGDAGDDLATDVDQALRLAALTSSVPGRLRIEATDLDRVASVLAARADLADGFELDLGDLAADLGVDEASLEAAVATIGEGGDDTPLLDLVAADRALTGSLSTSLRDAVPGLPEPGQDEATDRAIEVFDARILPRLQNGETIDPNDLTKGERKALRVVTGLVGGDETTIRVTRRETFRGGRGDDEYRTVTEDIPLTETSPDIMLGFVTSRLQPQGVTLAAIGGDAGGAGGDAGRGDGSDQGRGEFDFDRFDGQGRPRTGSIEGDINQIFGTDPSTSDVQAVYEGGGRYSITVDDPSKPGNGDTFVGTYTITDDGYTIDVERFDAAGRRGTVRATFDGDGFDTREDLPGGGTFESTGFPDGSTVSTTTNPDGSKVTNITTPFDDPRFPNATNTRSIFELPDSEKVSDDDPDRFRKRGDDADQNGFPDFGDARDTIDPNDPNDTGGNGLL